MMDAQEKELLDTRSAELANARKRIKSLQEERGTMSSALSIALRDGLNAEQAPMAVYALLQFFATKSETCTPSHRGRTGIKFRRANPDRKW